MKKQALIAIAALFSFSATPSIMAHCQVPCGIYSDDTVLIDLVTHQKTIEKAMTQITELSKDPGANANMLTRWITNKDDHATKLQITMTEYFLAQRLKIDEADKEAYLKKLILAHEIIVYAMKCKQTTDLENAKKLHTAIDSFTKAYQTK
ncbi:MAG: superoxide dismutase [Ni] [Akkermansiaceae bacterium]